jgi:MAP3K TRAFs-binding domain
MWEGRCRSVIRHAGDRGAATKLRSGASYFETNDQLIGEGAGMNAKKRCFVLMGFGKKTDYKTNRTLDLDKTYGIIRNAVEKAGLECIRADDIVHSGVIDVPMYENLLSADVAIADLSTSNENAIYELGVRHALKPHTTIVLAETEYKFPFDLNHLVIRTYKHLGEGIDYQEAARLESELVTALDTIVQTCNVDSPVYTCLPNLQPPSVNAVAQASGSAAPAAPSVPTEKFSTLFELFGEAKKVGDFTLACGYLKKLREIAPDDAYLIQQHALATYKSKQPSVLESLKEALGILQQLNPETSGDPETLGLWGAVHKRLWDVTHDRGALDDGIAAYERGYYMKRDHYTGINYVFMLNERASQQTDPDEATADRVSARRVARQLLTIVGTEIAAMPRDEAGTKQDKDELYWREATRVEALLVLDDPEFAAACDKLYAQAPESWMKQSTADQLDAIRRQKAAAAESQS